MPFNAQMCDVNEKLTNFTSDDFSMHMDRIGGPIVIKHFRAKSIFSSY